MLKLLIVLSVVVVIALLLFLMPISVKLKTIRKNEDDVIIVRLKTLYGLLNIKFELPKLDITFVNNRPALKYKAELESNKTSKLWKKVSKIFTADDFQNVKKYFHHDPVLLNRLKNYWSKKLHIEDFSFILKYGTSDAALTALLYGTAWTFLGTLLSIIDNNLNFKAKNILITPYFDKETFAVEFSCIIKFKFGNIINTGIMVLKRRRELKKAKHSVGNSLNAS